MMHTNLQSELREHLHNGEQLLWTGKPQGGIIFRISDAFLIPFSLLWCGFAIFWMVMASGAGGFFFLFGLPFVFIGLIFVFGRFIIDAKMRDNTVYGITEERIIIKSGIFNRTIQSVNIKAISNLEYLTKKDGRGTISIGPKSPYTAMGNGMNWWPGVKLTPQLELIPDARKVYNIILDQQKSS